MTLDPEAILRLAYASHKRALDAERAADELWRLTLRTWEAVRISRNLIDSSDSAIHRFRTLANNCALPQFTDPDC